MLDLAALNGLASPCEHKTAKYLTFDPLVRLRPLCFPDDLI